MTTPTLRWRQSEHAARAMRPSLRTYIRATLLPSTLRATAIGALFAAGLRWTAGTLRPDVTLPWTALLGGILAVPAAIMLGALVLLVAPPRAEYRVDRRGIVRDGQRLLRWRELTAYARVPSLTDPAGADVLLGRRDGSVDRVPLPHGALEQQVLAILAAHAPEQIPIERSAAAGQALMHALSGRGALVLYGGIAVYAVGAGFALAMLIRALRPGTALAWGLALAPMLLGPGVVLAVYAHRRHELPARQACALALVVNLAASSLAWILSVLFVAREVAGP